MNYASDVREAIASPQVIAPNREVTIPEGGVCVVHLAHREYGVAAFEAFLSSYRRYASGIEHRLLIVLKGFASEGDADEFVALLADVQHQCVFVDDGGFDLGSYFIAVEALQCDVYCFLNSRSVILAEHWLAYLVGHALRPDVGIAGATGSNQSLLTDHLDLHRFADIPGPRWRSWLRRSFINTMRHRLYFPPFPNPHLRTNAFAIRRELFVSLQRWPFRSRHHTAQFENGRRSVTRQLAQRGLQSVIVGRDGQAYPPVLWNTSDTFWLGSQSNLLIADNQTARYATADVAEQRFLCARAWGDAVAARALGVQGMTLTAHVEGSP
jgi:hypothetical protein